MHIEFNQDKSLSEDIIQIRARKVNNQLLTILKSLSDMTKIDIASEELISDQSSGNSKNTMSPSRRSLTIETKTGVDIIAFRNLVMIDVTGNQLSFVTSRGVITAKGTLAAIKAKLDKHEFIQISKNTIININHLQHMDVSFSGNMIARLSGGAKASVSRRYVNELKKC